MLRYILAILLFGISSSTIERAGIILHHTNTSILFVKSALTGRWSFTKGHREPYDLTFRDTAVREVFEEVGFKEGTDYTVDTAGSRLYGRSLYWTGKVTDPCPIPLLNLSEHSEAAWMTAPALQSLRKTPDVKAWLKSGAPSIA